MFQEYRPPLLANKPPMKSKERLPTETKANPASFHFSYIAPQIDHLPSITPKSSKLAHVLGRNAKLLKLEEGGNYICIINLV